MTKRIGIMMELMWPYRRHLDVFAGTQRFAKSRPDWQCEVDEFHSDLPRRQSQISSYDGIIARAGSDLAARARRVKVPLVNVWYSSPVRDRLPGTFPDFRRVGVLAAEHLIERGFRQFGCISRPREIAHQEMVAVFHDQVGKHGCDCQSLSLHRYYYRNGKSWGQFQRQLDEWISSWTPPMALFVAFNDVTIRYVVNACRRRKLRVPEDVALIGASNEPNIGELPPPSLSSVEVNYEQIGYQAAEMLAELMQGRTLRQQHVLHAPTSVIARDSTDYFAVDDEVVAAAMRFIERNTTQDIGVDDVAEAAGVSRRTLERRFRIGCGRSVAKEVRRLRLLKAKRLLAETDMQVKQIARESGFRDPIRMYEVFIREEGTTPTEYRSLARGEADG